MSWFGILSICCGVAWLALSKRCGTASTVIAGPALFIVVQAARTWSERRARRRQAIASGCEPMPCARGRWPGNLDLLLEAQRRADFEPPAAYMAVLARQIGSHTFDMRPLGGSARYTQDPEVIRHILAGNQTNWVKGQFLNELFADVLGSCLRDEPRLIASGTGIFNSDGEAWKAHRSTARPFFAKSNLTDMSIYETHSVDLLAVLDRYAGQPVNVHDLFARFTLDTAGHFIFGARLDAVPNYGSQPLAPAYLACFDRAQEALAARLDLGDLWKVFEIFGRPVRAAMKTVAAVVDRAIDAAIENSAHVPSGTPPTLIRMLLDTMGRTDPAAVRDEALNVLMAARDTTASLMASLFYELARHPADWHRARAEVIALLGIDGIMAFEDVKRLKFLRAAINEALRLYPPISANSRVALADDTIVADGRRLRIFAGDHVGWSVIQVQRRPDLYGKDADVWRPDRWFGPHASNPSSPAFQAWGYGPRVCIGQELAYIQTTFLFVKLLQSFASVALAPDAQPAGSYIDDDPDQGLLPQAPVITLKLKGGIWARLERSDG